MSDIELVIKRCKRLETLLEGELGASGRGLHEKVSSVQDSLPHALVKRLRFIASVRNKLVHEPDSDQLDNRRDYEQACDLAEKELKKLGGGKEAAAGSWAMSTGFVVALIIAIVALTFLIFSAAALVLGGGFNRIY